MSVRIEKELHVWTIIHSRPEVRNGMDPESAQALMDAFIGRRHGSYRNIMGRGR